MQMAAPSGAARRSPTSYVPPCSPARARALRTTDCGLPQYLVCAPPNVRVQWREYGKADKRWEVYDANVLSLEALTVFIMGPLALMMMYGVRLSSAVHARVIILPPPVIVAVCSSVRTFTDASENCVLRAP
ncbi:hypothetical protein EON62_04950 [archaeon]|nr:MAG: hypothetical protein EON62_04950 [archaeon]